jgi:hypothetical protein
MKTWHGLCVLVGVSAVFGLARKSCSKESAADAAADERLQVEKQLLEDSVDWYDVLPERDAKVGQRPEVVLRWQNAVRVNTRAALLAIWTDQCRPEAMATIFHTGNQICHEFGLLSRSKNVVLRDKTRVVWSPGTAGVEFHDLPDAPGPAEDRAARLRQMKSLAERFTAQLRPPRLTRAILK